MKRFTKNNPCPVCGGHDNQERGKSQRCHGFLSNDGNYAYCSREQYAGGLPLITKKGTNCYCHWLVGLCHCGTRHNLSGDMFAGGQKSVVAQYDYTDEQGEVLYQVCRTNPKGFFQRKPDAKGGWENNLKGVRRVLYRLPELLGADKSATVHICEGEADVDALRSLGFVATTNSSGAGKWNHDYKEHLRGRHVAILPDNDEAGRMHAEQVSKSLDGIAASVKVVTLPGLPDKGDVSDWLKAGGTKEQLKALVQDATPYDASLNSSDSSNSSDSHAPAGEQGITGQVAFPKLNRSKALSGLAGDIVRIIEPHSEADPTALLVQLLVAFGNGAGRSAHFIAEADRHYTNLFTVIVGESSRGRKGSSLGYIRRLMEEANEKWAGSVVGGLTSGEGLVHYVRDENEGLMLDAVRRSKNALVTESEFASVLQAQNRKGSTLSTCIRQAWDTGNLAVMRRDQPDKATNAHISIIAHITGQELRRCLQETDTRNGYANRFLWVASRRSKMLPEGGYFNLTENAPLVLRLRKAIEFASTVGEMKRDEGARELWLKIYKQLDEELPSGQLEAILSRAEAQIMRLACIYALLDCSPVVERVHLESAKAVWDYCVASTRYIFGQVLSKKAQKFLDILGESGTAGLNKTELFRKNGGRGDGLNEALEELRKAGYAFPLDIPTAGRDEERWFAVSAETTNGECDEFDEESQHEMVENEHLNEHVPRETLQEPDERFFEWMERAAIMEFDASLPRAEAERLAFIEVVEPTETNDKGQTSLSQMFG